MSAGIVTIHLVLLTALAALVFTVVRCLPPDRRKLALPPILVTGLTAQLAVILFQHELANALQWPDLVLFSQGYVHLAVAVTAAALAAPSSRASRRRTAVLAVGLVGVALWGSRGLMVPEPIQAPGRVEGPVVMQTGASTCAPAAAATLLRVRNIDPHATEAELAERSLTHPTQGTTDLGLYRGLVRSAPTRQVRFEERDLDGLRALDGPCLVFVGLERDRVPDEELYVVLRDDCGWTEGTRHAVVFFGFRWIPEWNTEVALIGDPRNGLERWSLAHFVALWEGTTLEVSAPQ